MCTLTLMQPPTAAQLAIDPEDPVATSVNVTLAYGGGLVGFDRPGLAIVMKVTESAFAEIDAAAVIANIERTNATLRKLKAENVLGVQSDKRVTSKVKEKGFVSRALRGNCRL